MVTALERSVSTASSPVRALAWSVASAQPAEIDEHSTSTGRRWRRCGARFMTLAPLPDLVLVDGVSGFLSC